MKPPAGAFQYVNESQLNSISKSLDEFFADIRSWFDVKTGDLKPNVQDFFDQSEDGCEARAWFEERLKTELSDIEDFMRLEQYIGALVATAAALVKDSTRQGHEAAARKFFFEACRGRSSGVVAESHIHLACMLGFLESFLDKHIDDDVTINFQKLILEICSHFTTREQRMYIYANFTTLASLPETKRTTNQKSCLHIVDTANWVRHVLNVFNMCSEHERQFDRSDEYVHISSDPRDFPVSDIYQGPCEFFGDLFPGHVVFLYIVPPSSDDSTEDILYGRMLIIEKKYVPKVGKIVSEKDFIGGTFHGISYKCSLSLRDGKLYPGFFFGFPSDELLRKKYPDVYYDFVALVQSIFDTSFQGEKTHAITRDETVSNDDQPKRSTGKRQTTVINTFPRRNHEDASDTTQAQAGTGMLNSRRPQYAMPLTGRRVMPSIFAVQRNQAFAKQHHWSELVRGGLCRPGEGGGIHETDVMFDFLDASSCRAYYAKHIQIILACVPVIEQSVNEETSWKWVPKEGFLAESKNILDADEEYAREHGHKYAKRIRAEIRAINKNPTPSRIQLISQALSNTEANKKFEDVTEFSELELQHAVELRRSQIVESTGRGEKLIEDMRAKVDELLENEEA